MISLGVVPLAIATGGIGGNPGESIRRTGAAPRPLAQPAPTSFSRRFFGWPSRYTDDKNLVQSKN